MAINKSFCRFPYLRGATFETQEAAPAPGPTMTQRARELLAELDRKAPAPVQTEMSKARALLVQMAAINAAQKAK